MPVNSCRCPSTHVEGKAIAETVGERRCDKWLLRPKTDVIFSLCLVGIFNVDPSEGKLLQDTSVGFHCSSFFLPMFVGLRGSQTLAILLILFWCL